MVGLMDLIIFFGPQNAKIPPVHALDVRHSQYLDISYVFDGLLPSKRPHRKRTCPDRFALTPEIRDQ